MNYFIHRYHVSLEWYAKYFIESNALSRTTNGSGGPAGAPGGGGSKRLAQQQAQVDEVVDIMRQNVDKVLERDKNLSLLDDRAGKVLRRDGSVNEIVCFVQINCNTMQRNLSNMLGN